MGKDKERKKQGVIQPAGQQGADQHSGPNSGGKGAEAMLPAEKIMIALERIEAKVDSCGLAITAINGKLDALSGRVTTLETKLEATERRLTDVELQCSKARDSEHTASKKATQRARADGALLARLEALENQARSAKFRVLGIPLGAEGPDPKRFMKQMLHDLLHLDRAEDSIYVDSCYRLPQQTGKSTVPGTPGPTLLITIPDLPDRDRLMEGVRKQKGGLQFKGHRVHIFPDLAPETIRRRNNLNVLKKQFLQLGVQAGLLYPAKLRITTVDKNYLFWDPADAEILLRKIQADNPAPMPDHSALTTA